MVTPVIYLVHNRPCSLHNFTLHCALQLLQLHCMQSSHPEQGTKLFLTEKKKLMRRLICNQPPFEKFQSHTFILHIFSAVLGTASLLLYLLLPFLCLWLISANPAGYMFTIFSKSFKKSKLGEIDRGFSKNGEWRQ